MDKWRKSRQLLERAKDSLAGGVSSPFRAKAVVPLYFSKGNGCHITDVDGNTYIDYALAWGPLILGHNNPRLCEVVAAAAAAGSHTIGAQHENEIEVSERIQRLVPCAERVAFATTGTEAVQLGLRLARAATGRNLILKFEGHYHGWMDSILISYHPSLEKAGPEESPVAVLPSRGQTPNSAKNVAIAAWNSIEAVEQTFSRLPGKIAAVIMEPVLCNSGCLIPEAGYLERVRKITQQNGALLIFDEVITGFRQTLGGAQQYYGVTPDLATFGKAIAGGVGLSAVAGRADIVELIVSGSVSFGGTLNGNPLAMAAARATLDELSQDSGAPLGRANQLGLQLMDGISARAEKQGMPMTVCGFGASFAVHFTKTKTLRNYRDTLKDDGEKLQRFLLLLLEQGIYSLPDGRFYISTAHTEEDIATTLQAVDHALDRMN